MEELNEVGVNEKSNLPKLGSDLISTLSTLNMDDFSHVSIQLSDLILFPVLLCERDEMDNSSLCSFLCLVVEHRLF